MFDLSPQTDAKDAIHSTDRNRFAYERDAEAANKKAGKPPLPLPFKEYQANAMIFLTTGRDSYKSMWSMRHVVGINCAAPDLSSPPPHASQSSLPSPSDPYYSCDSMYW
eukprot:scaffold22874_cov59-Cyclotella_meneghiniana.AAC.4